MTPLLQFAQAHQTAIETFLGVAAAAMIHTMPETIPVHPQELWTWLRDGLQTALPIRRTSTPQQPVGPAK